MERLIKYKDISIELKEEIDVYRARKVAQDSSYDGELAVNEWFEYCFDAWMDERFKDDDSAHARRSFRIDIVLPVKVTDTLVNSSDEPLAHNMIGSLVNVSRGGLYFVSPVAFQISSVIKVQIDLSAVSPDLGCIEALAMVMRLDQLEKGFGLGLMFSSIYDERLDRPDLEIFKNLAYFLYN